MGSFLLTESQKRWGRGGGKQTAAGSPMVQSIHGIFIVRFLSLREIQYCDDDVHTEEMFIVLDSFRTFPFYNSVFQQAMPFTLQSVAELREISYKDEEMNCGEPHRHALNPCQDFVSYTHR